jgi:hypothetical protein
MAYNTTNKYARDTIRDISFFESKFGAKIEDSKEYRQYVSRMPYVDWNGNIPLNVEAQVVPMKCIHLPAERLEDLIREQDYLKYVEERSDYALKVLDMLRADERVRDNNPAVQKAYRNYLTLLELARK